MLCLASLPLPSTFHRPPPTGSTLSHPTLLPSSIPLLSFPILPYSLLLLFPFPLARSLLYHTIPHHVHPDYFYCRTTEIDEGGAHCRALFASFFNDAGPGLFVFFFGDPHLHSREKKKRGEVSEGF